MDQDPFKSKSKQEHLAVRVAIATPEDWQVCKDLRLLSITGDDAKMFGLTPEKEYEEKNKAEKEWREESSSVEMFSVLAWNNSQAVGLGRTKQAEKGIWRVRNGYVKPEFRNMGIQQKMLALRLSEIQKRGGIKALTGIRTDNPISVHVAEKFGFKTMEVDNGWYMMELDLTKLEVIKKINEVLNAG